MVKPAKFFRKQAEKAERIARTAPDDEVAQNLTAMAKGYRGQADALKQSKKKKSPKAIKTGDAPKAKP
jgi:hypothetical protein